MTERGGIAALLAVYPRHASPWLPNEDRRILGADLRYLDELIKDLGRSRREILRRRQWLLRTRQEAERI